jgi:hypothetical protein
MIVKREEVRRSKRKLKVPMPQVPPNEASWADQESDEDPTYVPPPYSSSSDDDVSLYTDEESDVESDPTEIETTESEEDE